ncbi:tRNA pseudouridine(38-40) synthase TruA [Enterococcus timonensis]|uniref:tRNA pseudouridine(38-40) synthase TruA n=1 Tax=Enterococcus timonensis TaxID=1852364 RepID=UPI0008D9001D|nr:tRNA pseudouridine(38-40) synthase TruA [Enterococcus timonensis]
MRYKAIIAYDGTNFHGFQVQPNGRTVEAELNKTLIKINRGLPVVVAGSGRTDAHVHARGQVIHFDLDEARDLEKLRYGIDTQSPADIACLSVEVAPDDFHARYHVVSKTYEFRVDLARARSPFKRHYASYFPYPLDVEKINAALQLLLGTHDFTGFCASGSSVENKVRTITEATVVHDFEAEELLFTFSGDGFLYKMVRIIVGTLLKIGNHRMPVDQITKILSEKNRQLAGPTAHPEGLYLKEVHYK